MSQKVVQLARIGGRGVGVRGNLGNARKKSIFLMWGLPLYPYNNSTIVSTCLTHDIVILRNGPNVATGDCVCWDRGFDYNGADLPIGEIFNWSRDLAKEKQDFPKKAFSTQNAKTFQFSLLLFSRSLPGRYTAACRPVRRCSVPAPRADIRFSVRPFMLSLLVSCQDCF